MINLSDTKFGLKRRLIIGGLNSFDVLGDSLNVMFYVQIIDSLGNLVDDKNIHQNRRVTYNVNNNNFVNAQFDKVNENTTGARKEFDYFFQLLQTTLFPTLILQLAEKLKSRGIFD